MQSPPLILIVDDDAEMRAYLEMALSGRGYRLFAADAPSGWAFQEIPSLAFVDLVTNGEPAEPFVRQLDAAGARVVLMTGLSGESPVVKACVEAGCCRVLHKPFSLAALRTLIDELLPR